MTFNIAIDGPSAAGKSTVAELLATQLAFIHLDTGMMYRALAYAAKVAGVAFDDEDHLEELLSKMHMQITKDGKVFIDDKDVTAFLHDRDIALGASAVSAFPKVRKAMVERQQKIASAGGYIMDGRDIGSVVLQDAAVKIYLVADLEDRAMRRHKQNLEQGIPSDYDAILKEIEQRDYQDMHRECSPLVKAEDAVEIDTTGLTPEESVDKIMELIKKKGLLND